MALQSKTLYTPLPVYWSKENEELIPAQGLPGQLVLSVGSKVLMGDVNHDIRIMECEGRTVTAIPIEYSEQPEDQESYVLLEQMIFTVFR